MGVTHFLVIIVCLNVCSMLPDPMIDTFAFAFGSLWNIFIICSDYTELETLLDLAHLITTV